MTVRTPQQGDGGDGLVPSFQHQQPTDPRPNRRRGRNTTFDDHGL